MRKKKITLNELNKKLEVIDKKISDKRKILRDYKNNMVVGVVSGLMVYITIFVHNIILEKSNNLVFAFIGGILILLLLWWYLVKRPIKTQERVWNAKKVK